MDTNFSLADLAAITKDSGLTGMNGFIYILLFAMIFGNNGLFGNRNGEYAAAQTAASQQEILFNQHFNNLDNKMDRGFTSIGNGISDLGYANQSLINNAQTTLGSAIVSEGRALGDKLCELKTAVHAEGEATRAMIQQNKIETLQAEVNDLKTQNMFCGIPRISPYGYVPINTTNGCGCNCNNI